MSRIESFTSGIEGNRIFGIFELPESGDSFPVVVMLHGFTGEHIVSTFKYPRLSRRLVESGVATVRFDFRGSGDSEGEFCDMSPLTELRDALEIVALVKEKSCFNGKLALIGYSMGGMVASLLAGREREFDAVLLWSPVIMNGEFFSREEYSFSSNEKYKDILGLKLGHGFQKDGLSVDAAAELANYRGPLMIIHGSEDESVPYEPVLRYARDRGIVFHTVKGANHKYQRLDWIEELFEVSEGFLCDRLL
ncbi:MAG TPA: alpha/beta fold hydrolase [Mesotoga sp.]|jgi:alpha/beta superfamily hydrolase|nr:alpha/beta fold hydrolase [Mesotoga sp.]